MRHLKHYLLAAVSAIALSAIGAALAQVGPTGQSGGGAINPTTFAAGTETAGFNEQAFVAVAVPATSTTQATFNAATGAVVTGTVIATKNTMITACSGTTGVTLPAVNRFTSIVIINRSGGSCLIWPTIGATVETALGTDGAANASFTMLTNTDAVFRPVSPTRWVQ